MGLKGQHVMSTSVQLVVVPWSVRTSGSSYNSSLAVPLMKNFKFMSRRMCQGWWCCVRQCTCFRYFMDLQCWCITKAEELLSTTSNTIITVYRNFMNDRVCQYQSKRGGVQQFSMGSGHIRVHTYVSPLMHPSMGDTCLWHCFVHPEL